MTARYPLRIHLWAWWHCRVEMSPNRVVRWLARRIYIIRRYLSGARNVECAQYGDTSGELVESGVDIQWGGACPVQGDGTVDGRECYYRSRGERWSFSVAVPGGDPLDDNAWEYGERRYFWPDGGWVSAAVSERCIRKAVALFREGSR